MEKQKTARKVAFIAGAMTDKNLQAQTPSASSEPFSSIALNWSGIAPSTGALQRDQCRRHRRNDESDNKRKGADHTAPLSPWLLCL
jgi:hypothetical protein